MSELNIGHEVYNLALNNTFSIIIMKKYDGNLSKLIYLYQTNNNIPIDNILNSLEQLIHKYMKM